MTGRPFAFLLVLGLALAGCAKAPLPGEVLDATDGVLGGLPTDGSPANGTGGARPTWVHGDWWRYQIRFDPGIGTPLFDASDKIVVASLAGGAYNLASGGRDLAVIDAEFNSFFVGPMDKDLTGAQGFGAVPFQMFEWPLADGASWQTAFELTDPNGVSVETTMDLTAKAIPDVGGVASGPGFQIDGTTPDGTVVSYTYSPQVEWITDFTWVNSNGLTIMAMTLEEFGAGYEGTFTQVTVDPLYNRAAVVPFFVFDPTIAPTPDIVTIGEASFVLRVVALFAFSSTIPPAPAAIPGAGLAGVTIVPPPGGQPQYFALPATSDAFTVDILMSEDFAPGQYEVGYALAGTGVGAFVLIHEFQETVTEFTAASHDNHGG